jgi:preprotein translocase subunit SecG
MYTFLSVIYVLVCLFLILVVLLQPGRGGIGGAFGGGSSQTVFGSSGAGNFLTRLTSVSAALFMILSATLAYMSSSSDKSLERAIEAQRAKQAAKAKEEAKDKGKDEKAPSSSSPGGSEGASAPIELLPEPSNPHEGVPGLAPPADTQAPEPTPAPVLGGPKPLAPKVGKKAAPGTPVPSARAPAPTPAAEPAAPPAAAPEAPAEPVAPTP